MSPVDAGTAASAFPAHPPPSRGIPLRRLRLLQGRPLPYGRRVPATAPWTPRRRPAGSR